VKGTGYPLHSPVSPSLPLPCVTVCHHTSTGVYQLMVLRQRHQTCGTNAYLGTSDEFTWHVNTTDYADKFPCENEELSSQGQ